MNLLRRPKRPAAPLSLDEIGLQLGIDQSSAKHDFLRHYQAELERLDPKAVALVAAEGGIREAVCFARFLPTADIVLYSLLPEAEECPVDIPPNVTQFLCGTMREVTQQARRQGRCDVLIEDGNNKKSQKLEAFLELFWQVEPGGIYICEDLHAAGIAALVDQPGEDILEMVNRLTSLRRMPAQAHGGVSKQDAELASSMGRVTNYGKLLVVEKTTSHLLKIVEGTSSYRYLRAQARSWMTERTLIPAMSYTPRASVTSNRPDLTSQRFPTPIQCPEIQLRSYDQVSFAPRQVLHKDGLLLPETFRLFPKRRGSTTQVQDCTLDYARLREREETPERLRGTYYHLDSEYPFMYGHLISEMVARLHGWRIAQREIPGIKLLLSTRGPGASERSVLKPWMAQMLGAFGIGEDQIHIQNSPAVVDQVIAATPLFSNMTFAHPAIKETWDELRTNLSQQSTMDLPEKIFVTRGDDLVRACRNQSQVENEFESRGYAVVRPERLPLPDQVAMFAKAREVTGFGGSGMINVLFCSAAEKALVISPETYTAINEYLISALLDIDLTYIYSDAELSHPPNGWSEKAFQSPFTFDFAREGDVLRSFFAP